jgi:L-fucose isomerase-like protein
MDRPTFGVIVGNRDFFPDRLVTEGRVEILSVLESLGIDVVILDEQATNLGATETWADAQRCADLFRANRDRIDGILVTLPNFGDEKGASDTIRLADLGVPVLVQATPDDPKRMGLDRRRDSFCGKISVCNNLVQNKIPFSLTTRHTVRPDSDEFRADLRRFVAVCRTVKGLRHARLGLVGARPNAFRTVRFSEKLLQAAGITVTTIDLSDVYGAASKLAVTDARVKAKLEQLAAYVDTSAVPEHPLHQMARLAAVLDEWMVEYGLQAIALQCWSSMQENFGINACGVMSLMSQNLLPSACETDLTGAVAMYALQLASGRPSALVDWNNNFGDDPNKCVFFHCGNWAKEFASDATIGVAEIQATTLGREHTYGGLSGHANAGPITYARVSTDDHQGRIRAIVGEGRFTDDRLDTFGMTGVVEIPRLQDLLAYICRNGFEHHVAMSASRVSEVVAEAVGTYLGWDLYRHVG